MPDIFKDRIPLDFGTCWFVPELRAFWFERNEVPANSIGKLDRMFNEVDALLKQLEKGKYLGIADMTRAPMAKDPEHQQYLSLRIERQSAHFHRLIIILATAEGKLQQKRIAAPVEAKVMLFHSKDVACEFAKNHPPP